jgi:hypothetical protein
VWTVVLAGNARARQLYESEGFQVVHTFASANAGYPCTCVQLALSLSGSHTPGSGGESPGEADRGGAAEQARAGDHQ